MTGKFEYRKKEFGIEITDKSIKPIGTSKFIGISKDVFKIYILKCSNEILYVGITKTYLSSRLALGFNATIKTGHNGYHGYKWIKSHKGKPLNLIVISFPNLTTKADREIVETIEAELVFRVREKFNKWPECQNEIHFYNNGKEVIEFSEKLFKEIIKEETKIPTLKEIAKRNPDLLKLPKEINPKEYDDTDADEQNGTDIIYPQPHWMEKLFSGNDRNEKQP